MRKDSESFAAAAERLVGEHRAATKKLLDALGSIQDQIDQTTGLSAEERAELAALQGAEMDRGFRGLTGLLDAAQVVATLAVAEAVTGLAGQQDRTVRQINEVRNVLADLLPGRLR